LPPGVDGPSHRGLAGERILGRGDLDATVACRPQDAGTLVGDRFPIPLEEVGDDVAPTAVSLSTASPHVRDPARSPRVGAGYEAQRYYAGQQQDADAEEGRDNAHSPSSARNN